MIETAARGPCRARTAFGKGCPNGRFRSFDETVRTHMDSDASTYVNTPYGMVSADGRWYHIPEGAVREYAGPVLDYVSLDTLVGWADAWIASPRTVTLWGLPVLLGVLPPGWAVGAALALYGGWMVLSPALPWIGGVRLVSGLSHVGLQALYYALTLSILAGLGQLAAMGVGLVGFVLLRWNIVDRMGGVVRQWVHPRLYPLPVADQVLRALIVRAALKHRVQVSQVEALTTAILENWGDRSEAETDPADPSSSSSST